MPMGLGLLGGSCCISVDGLDGVCESTAVIVVQRVLTEWTKQSRGAPGAVRRNAVAEAFPLRPAGNAEVLLHRVVAREETGFAVQQRTPESYDLPQTGPLILDGPAGVRLEKSNGQLVVTGVTDVWCQCFTVFPPRSTGTVLRLEVGQWGRWRLNFRLWEDDGRSEWMYQKWVVNVAYLPGPPPADLFRTTAPASVSDDMAQISHPTRSDRTHPPSLV